MSTSLTRRSAITAGLALGASLAVSSASSAQAATGRSACAPVSAGITRLQWTGIALSSRQYPAMKEFTEKALGLTAVSTSEEFSVFALPNGNLFELYGPKAPQYPWRTSTTSTAVGFDSSSLPTAEAALSHHGARWVSRIYEFPGAGAGGTDYRFRFFRAPDDRVYGVAQSNFDPHQPVAAGATGSAGINKLQWTGIDLTAGQYIRMREFTDRGLGLNALSTVTEFTVFGTENGNLFELYGPKAPQYPWRTSHKSIAMGFNTIDLDAAMRHLERHGAKWVSGVYVVPGAGAGGTDYRFRLFRAPDNRVYGVAQSNATS
ncbi:VOC family protein [Streptomyces sp. NPDC090088]|uniref:VOC family protein n=1 Tax=Streptomyces sp. NPDC090088 TaxID=3365944 RepID=UPI0038142194